MKKINLSGGFHQVGNIKIQVSNNKFNELLERFDNKSYESSIISGQDLDEFLTDSQKKRLEKHFCGIKDCTCGGYYRDCHIEIK